MAPVIRKTIKNYQGKPKKLRKLYIENYKALKDFTINFVDENKETLPIIILAGINGSGKTTILESLSPHYVKNSSLNVSLENNGLVFKLLNSEDNTQTQVISSSEITKCYPKIEGISGGIIYLKAEINQLGDIEKKIADEYIITAEEIDSFKMALKNIQKKLDNIFQGLDIGFKVSRIDYNKKHVFLVDSRGYEFRLDSLSTGEKTLLSKVLSLYFNRYEGKIILIDEPELSLHPSWQNKVLKIYENFAFKNNCQIIIATHSPHIIGSAKPEYLRLLKKEDDKIVVVDNVDKSYGLEFDKILTDIMGVEDLRTPTVSKDIKTLWKLLENEEYQTKEYEKIYQKLEKDLGDLDKDLVLARLEVARIKSRNAKSK